MQDASKHACLMGESWTSNPILLLWVIEFENVGIIKFEVNIIFELNSENNSVEFKSYQRAD